MRGIRKRIVKEERRAKISLSHQKAFRLRNLLPEVITSSISEMKKTLLIHEKEGESRFPACFLFNLLSHLRTSDWSSHLPSLLPLSLSLLQSGDSFSSLISVSAISILLTLEEKEKEGKGEEGKGGEGECMEKKDKERGERERRETEFSLTPYYGPLLFSLRSTFGRKDDGFPVCSLPLFLSISSREWAGVCGRRDPNEGEEGTCEERERFPLKSTYDHFDCLLHLSLRSSSLPLRSALFLSLSLLTRSMGLFSSRFLSRSLSLFSLCVGTWFESEGYDVSPLLFLK